MRPNDGDNSEFYRSRPYAAYWSAVAEDASNRARTAAAAQAMTDLGPAVLEVGCGEGAFARRLAPQVARYVAIDISRDQVRHARETSGDARVDWVVADAARLPFKPRSFTGSFAVALLYFVPDRAAVVGEMARVTRGTLYAEFKRLDHASNRVNRLKSAIAEPALRLIGASLRRGETSLAARFLRSRPGRRAIKAYTRKPPEFIDAWVEQSIASRKFVAQRSYADASNDIRKGLGVPGIRVIQIVGMDERGQAEANSAERWLVRYDKDG